MKDNWSTYYDNAKKYLNYYKTFSSYVGPQQDYGYTNRRRGAYY